MLPPHCHYWWWPCWCYNWPLTLTQQGWCRWQHQCDHGGRAPNGAVSGNPLGPRVFRLPHTYNLWCILQCETRVYTMAIVLNCNGICWAGDQRLVPFPGLCHSFYTVWGESGMKYITWVTQGQKGWLIVSGCTGAQQYKRNKNQPPFTMSYSCEISYQPP